MTFGKCLFHCLTRSPWATTVAAPPNKENRWSRKQTGTTFLSLTSLFQSSSYAVPVLWKAKSAIAAIIITIPLTTFIQIRWANSWIIKHKSSVNKLFTLIRARAKTIVVAPVLVDLEALDLLTPGLEPVVKWEMPVVAIPATYSRVEATRAGRQQLLILSTSLLCWIPLTHRDSHRVVFLARITWISNNQRPQTR